MPCASLSMLNGPGGIGCNVRVIVVGRDVIVSAVFEQYEIYKHYKQSPTNLFNDQILYKSHTLFDTIKHSSHNNISATSSKMNKILHSAVNLLVQHNN